MSFTAVRVVAVAGVSSCCAAAHAAVPPLVAQLLSEMRDSGLVIAGFVLAGIVGVLAIKFLAKCI